MKHKQLLLLLTLLSFNGLYVHAQQKPNFILIVADDLGYADLSLTGSKQINTPNIDRLAFEGVNFTQGYVSAPVCSPSRAGFLTGRNQVHFGHDNNLSVSPLPGFDPKYFGLPLSETTIADRLKKLGYVTGLVGKWHLGYDPQFHPTKRGFDEFWGYTGGGHDYFKSEPEGKGYMSPIECNYKTAQPITYITDDKGDECVDFIKRHKKEPFFLFASFNAPHGPLQATEEDLKLFEDIEDKKRRTYLAMIHRLDVNVGKILNTVKKEGLDKNTLIVFISDNGGPISNGSLNAPYNGKKGILLEGGIHVPYIMKWTGRIPAKKTYEEPVISLDFAATFFEEAGGKITDDVKLDGVNLIPYITGEKEGIPHEAFNWRFTISAAIREGDWKLIRLPDRLPILYNLSEDISEQDDVSLQNMDKTKAMLKKLGDWDVRLPHPYFLEGQNFKAIQLDSYDDSYQLEQPER